MKEIMLLVTYKLKPQAREYFLGEVAAAEILQSISGMGRISIFKFRIDRSCRCLHSLLRLYRHDRLHGNTHGEHDKKCP